MKRNVTFKAVTPAHMVGVALVAFATSIVINKPMITLLSFSFVVSLQLISFVTEYLYVRKVKKVLDMMAKVSDNDSIEARDKDAVEISKVMGELGVLDEDTVLYAMMSVFEKQPGGMRNIMVRFNEHIKDEEENNEGDSDEEDNK